MGNLSSGKSGYYITYSSAVEGPNYNYHPDYNQELIHSDYSHFYAGIGICALIAILLLIFNLIFGCCSPWKNYWNNKNTGNKLVLPLFITPPKDQEPILI